MRYDESCVIVAEIGINHNGNMQLAIDSILAAKAAGADAVKFQNYKTEDFLSDDRQLYTYISQGQQVTESQFTMFKRCELTDENVCMLAKTCKKIGILFLSTPTNEHGLGILQKVGASYIKNGSDYLTHLSLIKAMAQTGIPTVLSTGMATLSEIDDAVRVFREAGGKDLVLLHCTSSYPAPPEDTHLRKIPTLRNVFGCPIGFSDHTEGISAAIGAVVLGACMIEKHFTLDKNLPGPDHRFSADPAEFQALVTGVRSIEKQLGEPIIGPTESELSNRANFTLSCVARKDLPAGHCLKESDIAFRRPGNGLRPRYANWLTGKMLKRPVSAGIPLTWDDV